MKLCLSVGYVCVCVFFVKWLGLGTTFGHLGVK